jgi:hypothetical protein
MIKITLNIEKFEQMKKGTAGESTGLKTAVVAATVGGAIAGTLLELASKADTKVGKTAKLLKELIRIFSI